MELKYECDRDDWERGNDDCLIYHGWESGSDALTPPLRPSVDLRTNNSPSSWHALTHTPRPSLQNDVPRCHGNGNDIGHALRCELKQACNRRLYKWEHAWHQRHLSWGAALAIPPRFPRFQAVGRP